MFSTPPSLYANTPFIEPWRQPRDSKHRGRQMLSTVARPLPVQAGGAFLLEPSINLTELERRQWAQRQKMAMAGPFRPSGPTKSSRTPGGYDGTFSKPIEHIAPYVVLAKGEAPPPPESASSPRGIYGSVAIPHPHPHPAAATTSARPEAKADQKRPLAGPFKAGAAPEPKPVVDTELHLPKIAAKSPPKESSPRPFLPASTRVTEPFNKFPEYTPEDYGHQKHQEKQEKEAERTKRISGNFLPSSPPKSIPIKPIMPKKLQPIVKL